MRLGHWELQIQIDGAPGSSEELVIAENSYVKAECGKHFCIRVLYHGGTCIENDVFQIHVLIDGQAAANT